MIIPVILPLIDQGWGLEKVGIIMIMMEIMMKIMIMMEIMKIIMTMMEIMMQSMNINMADDW